MLWYQLSSRFQPCKNISSALRPPYHLLIMKLTPKLLAVIFLGTTIPINGLALSKRQDPDCDFANVNEGIGPKIDGARWITDCDRPDGLILDSDGQCPGKEKVEAGPDIDCNRYCELRRRYYQDGYFPLIIASGEGIRYLGR